MSELPQWNPRAMHLRLLRADDVGDDAADTEQLRTLSSPALTLCQYGVHCLIPDKLEGKRDPATIQRVRDALNWWRTLTGDPAMAIISDRDVTLFEQLLRQQRGRKGPTLAPETVRQTLVRVRYVMRQAAKMHVVHGRRLKFLDSVPDFELPKKTKTDPQPYTYDELLLILAGCQAMTWPELPGVAPSAFWRALVEYFYYEGCRLAETLQLEYANLAGDVLKVPDAIAKHGHGASIRLQPESLEAIESIRTARKYIFELPRGWRMDLDKIKREMKKLLRAAGVYQPWRVFHGLRRTNASEVARIAGKEAAQQAMRHTDARTTEAYISRDAERDHAYQVKRLLKRLPKDDGRQLRLPFSE